MTRWEPDEEYSGPYPEGARDKSAIYCPDVAPQSFLVAGHRYLFKHSVKWAPAQFWCEIAAYRIGERVGVWVPPAHAGYDTESGCCGALIEWFYGYPNETVPARYTSGGDHLADVVEHFDRDKGTKHNFKSTIVFCRALRAKRELAEDWLEYWAKVFAFDALIGNTDRHQDNWGFLWRESDQSNSAASFAPAFDNGTSMGYEMQESRLSAFASVDWVERYVDRGTHHMRWDLESDRIGHRELLVKLCEEHPAARDHILGCLYSVTPEDLEGIVSDLTLVGVPQPLSEARAEFMGRILRFRHAWLTAGLE